MPRLPGSKVTSWQDQRREVDALGRPTQGRDGRGQSDRTSGGVAPRCCWSGARGRHERCGLVPSDPQAPLRRIRALLCCQAVREWCSVGQGEVWSENPKEDDAPPLLAFESGYQLLPVVRAQSSDLSLNPTTLRVPLRCAASCYRSTTICGPAWRPGSRPAPGRSRRRRASGATVRDPRPPRRRSAWPGLRQGP
jgi:hypothetical protein